jgi:hypothetical protein
MTARERLEGYLDAMRRRLLAHIYARAAAAAAVGTLLVTCVSVWALQRAEFAPALTLGGRIVLIVMLAAIAALLLWLPLRRLRSEDGALIYETHLPEEHGRIQTYLDGRRREASGIVTPLLDLLAADAATVAERRDLDEVVSRRPTMLALGLAAVGVGALTVLLATGPGFWGFGSRHLLLGADLPRTAVSLRRVTVTPGNATVRRNSDMAIRASVEGFHAREAQLFVRFADQAQWERAPMLPAAGESGPHFEFRLYAVRGPLQYYVDADGTRSAEHSVAVVDLPRIERVRLTYAYPEWTGLGPSVEETVRDIRAVAGTDVKVEVFSDAPLDQPALIVDGKVGKLAQDGRASVGNIPVSVPGHYQIGARVADEFVALSDEYAIEIVADEEPAVEIRKPARDWRATSIDEVPVRVEANDDFRLRDVTLRYSVNGGDWQNVPLGAGVKHAQSESLLRLEEIGRTKATNPEKRLVPGDLVSYYAVAKDHRQSAETDLFIVQVQPFERRFTQAQSGAAGGGMSDEQGAISERQREILLATWNLQRNDERHERSRQQLEDSATMLSDLQATLAQQARTLAERTRARTSIQQDERVKTFVESLERAATIMEPASQHLKDFSLREAVPFEQQALQQLLRAESAFREVQISMQQDSSAGDGAQTARNFTEMFELEMDLEKNQYESESQVSMQNARKDIDEVMRKLKELAQRQEALAEERNRSPQFDADQRWRQEQLRREAEDLRRRLEQMDAQRSRQGKQNGQQSEEGEQRSASGSGDRQREQVARALESVNRALQNMRSANGGGASGTGQDPAGAAQAAGRELRQALQRIDQREPSHFDAELQKFANRAEQMAEEQRGIEDKLHEALGQDPRTSRNSPYGSIDQRRAQELVQSKQKMAEDLTTLQGDMRNAVHEYRAQSPETTRRLSEIVRDVEGSDVMYRLNRSAAEIYYGRARDAAAKEGLITDALDILEGDLRDAAEQAAREKSRVPNEATPDALLSQIAEMRRALEEAGTDGNGNDGARKGRDGTQQGGEQSGNAQQPNGAAAGERRGPGLAAWDPVTLGTWPRDFQPGAGSLARQTDAIGQRIRDIANRMGRRDLSAAELQALRRQATELRRLSGDPMAANYAAMLKLIDQLELTALAAARHQDETSARTETRLDDAPRYRESVAEYYRRLGNR